MLLATLAALLCQSAPVPAADGPRVELPEGAASRAVALLRPDTKPAEIPAPLALGADPWATPAVIATWSSAVARASADRSALAPRAELALLSLAQERYDDAWAHFAACAEQPEIVAALLPRFLPGAVSTSAIAELADGAVLRPALPPPSARAADARVDRRAMSVQRFRVGAAELSLKVSVEAEGVQIEVRHLAGGACKLSIVLPQPSDAESEIEYVDWYRQETLRTPHELALEPGGDERVVYARLAPRPSAWPRSEGALAAQLRLGELWLEVARDDARSDVIEALARALAAPPFGLRATTRDPRDPRPTDANGVAVDLAASADRPRKLAHLVSAAERLALAPR